MNLWPFTGWLLIFLVLAITDSRVARIHRNIERILTEVKRTRTDTAGRGE
jgi:hypothetical protein